jgi:hypothetical protein
MEQLLCATPQGTVANKTGHHCHCYLFLVFILFLTFFSVFWGKVLCMVFIDFCIKHRQSGNAGSCYLHLGAMNLSDPLLPLFLLVVATWALNINMVGLNNLFLHIFDEK